MRTPDDLELLVEWLNEYGRLMTDIKLRTNFGKFVLMQHAERAGTDLNVATILERPCETPCRRTTGRASSASSTS